MTKEQILQRAIEKAIENGFKLKEMNGRSLKEYRFCRASKTYSLWNANGGRACYIPNPVIIFSHSFAKAFFGEEPMCEPWKEDFGGEHDDCQEPKWQYHIKRMVISDDAIKYLEKFL